MNVKLSFDLLCDKKVPKLPYRVTVNGELMTERDYIWDNNEQYLREHVPLELEPGVHSLEVINLDNRNGNFSINNITVNGVSQRLVNGRDFTV